jgi:hypothetical protein
MIRNVLTEKYPEFLVHAPTRIFKGWLGLILVFVEPWSLQKLRQLVMRTRIQDDREFILQPT